MQTAYLNSKLYGYVLGKLNQWLCHLPRIWWWEYIQYAHSISKVVGIIALYLMKNDSIHWKKKNNKIVKAVGDSMQALT